MPKPATGQITTKTTSDGRTSYGARFRAYGTRRYQQLGYSPAMTPTTAQLELQAILADVRRGIWQPPEQIKPPEPAKQMPSFHEFASEWFAAQKLEGGHDGTGLSPAGVADLEWRLSNHLLPAFASKRLDAITVEDVDRYRRGRVAAGLGATSINKQLATLSAILEQAVDYELVSRNVAKGKKRRLPAAKPRRTYLDRAEHIAALLHAGGQLDQAGKRTPYRRALLATLVLGGLRHDEALRLRWRHVDLARGVIRVPGTKTAAAERTVNVLPLLRDELVSHAAAIEGDREPDALVFGSGKGNKQSPSNVRRRVLAKAVELANEQLDDELPDGLTPQSLRRTFASLLYALGEAPPYVMAQMGHTTPHLALAVYAREMDRRDGEPERLRALVQGEDWAPMGTSDVQAVADGLHADAA
jgi:integrase